MQRRRNIDNWGRGGGADIHIFVCTDCKNNRFQKKLIGQNTNIIDIPAPLVECLLLNSAEYNLRQVEVPEFQPINMLRIYHVL
jgi:hypothetical protein